MSSLSWFFLRCQAKRCQYERDIAVFLHQNQQRYLSHKKLYHVLSLYEKWWISVGSFRSEPFERYVLHYLIERTFWSDLRDRDFVTKLLVFLFQAESHFGFLLCPDIDCLPSLDVFEGGNDRLPQFFLDHAYRQHLVVCGKRIVDLKVFFRSLWLHPCEMAVITESPTLLRLFLQYGAFIPDDTVSPEKITSYPDSGSIVIITLCIIKTILEILQGGLWHNRTGCGRTKAKNMVLCGRLMIRASPQMEKCIVHQAGIEFPGFHSSEEALTWIGDEVLTELKYRVYLPVPLKHACRLAVRKNLHLNWQLPFGIEELPIPHILKEYLNLESD